MPAPVDPIATSRDVPAALPEDATFLPLDLPSQPAEVVPNVRIAQIPAQADEEIVQATPGLQLKPITAIMPYHDYTPDSANPCEFLCPRPPGCEDDNASRPCPEAIALPTSGQVQWQFPYTQMYWEPSNLFANPLYFEDFSLERYGHGHHHLVQPFVSVGKFGAQFIGLPYQLALHPMCEHQYVLGWYQPGDCVPKLCYQIPWNTKAAISASAAYTGLVFLIP